MAFYLTDFRSGISESDRPSPYSCRACGGDDGEDVATCGFYEPCWAVSASRIQDKPDRQKDNPAGPSSKCW